MSSLPNTTPRTLDTGAVEIARIRAEYERRKREVPGDYYGWRRPENYFHHASLVRDAIDQLARQEMFPLGNKRVADIGCGTGRWLLEFAQWDASELCGIDLDETRVNLARERLPSADLRAGDARFLPWPDESFDLVSQFTLFTSILDRDVKRQIAEEMLRVLKPQGAVLWFDFRLNNPRNRNVCGIPSDEIRSLFPDCTVQLRRVILAPPIARLVVPVSWIAASMLEKLPFLRTHILGTIRKRVRW